MEKDIEKALDIFVETSEKESNDVEQKNENVKKVVLDEREGLIERVDRIYVDKSGRQLLREQY